MSQILSVLFAPGTAPQQLIVMYLAAAKVQIRALVYTFTDPLILAALIAAKNRGVDVAVIADAKASGEKGELALAAAQAGIPVRLDSVHRIMHDKSLVVDSAIVLTGSYN